MIEQHCIIIGGGPAGLTTAIYLQRFRRSTLVIDGAESRVKDVPKIRNLVGYDRGISGQALLQRLRRQARKFHARIIQGHAVIHRCRSGFEVRVNGSLYFSKYVVLATGFKDQQPKGVDFSHLCRRGFLAYCPICDGFDHRDQSVGVLINSSAGFRRLKFLYNFTKKLHVILIREIPIPSRHLEKIRKLGIRVHVGSLQSLRIGATGKSLSVKLRGQRSFEVDMAYVAMGIRTPQGAVRHLGKLRRSAEGLFLVDHSQETSIKGLFAVGDCVKNLAQVSVAVGQAAVAATKIHQRLSR